MRVASHFEIDIELIRHGEVKFNEEKRYISFTDQPLSTKGAAEIKARASSGYYKRSELIFVSPLKRAIETASLIFGEQAQVQLPELAEINFGVFEGKTYSELLENLSYKNWLNSGGKCKIENGESREEFEERIALGLKKVLAISREKKQISIVAHGGTVMALIDKFTDLDYYDVMLKSGQKIGLKVFFEIKGNEDVSISRLGITYRDDS